MGQCISSRASEEIERDKEVEKQLREAKRQMAIQSKVLLLGSGDSGKSTLLKQMRVINATSTPFTPREVESYRQIIWRNLREGVSSVRDVMEELEIYLSEDLVPLFQQLQNAPDVKDSEPFPPFYLPLLRAFWQDPTVQKAVTLGRQLALPDNLTYFFNDLPRLFDATYVPTNQDIIYARARTTGITQTHFKMGKKELIMVDVGGQRSERRKWISCFQDVTAILFLVSLSGYDQCLVEERSANQMLDAMSVWDSICSSQWFKETSMILFLNKEDLFREKIRYSSIRQFFPDFDGEDGNAEAAMQYFQKRFLRITAKANKALMAKSNQGANWSNIRQVYPHYTTAVDTDHIRIVMRAVSDIIIRDHFEKSALL